MGEENNDLYDKDIKVKGIDTVEGTDPVEGVEPDDEKNKPVKVSEPEQPKKKDPFKDSFDDSSSSYLNWKTPETEKEAFDQRVAGSLGVPGESSIKGNTGPINAKAYEQAFAPVNLGKYIPDPGERQKFLDGNGKSLFQLDEQTYGITFENEIADLMKFKQKEYPKKMKRFLDDLDDSQSWYSEGSNMLGRFVGSTGLAISSFVPMIYGLGNAAVEGDMSKVFDNPLMDGWDAAQDWVTQSTVIYGGSDVYNINPETGEFTQKEFFARFYNDPIKSLNQDIVPAASFIAGAIGTELIAGVLAPVTGGTALAANTARLAAAGKKIFSGRKLFNTSMKAIRGLDDSLIQMSKLKNSAQFKTIQKSLGKGVSTVARGWRSAAYESTLIARDTQERTLNNILIEHHKDNGGKVNDEGMPIGEMVEPDEETLVEYEEMAAEAGEMAYMVNIPLVAGSNFVQFPKIYMKSYLASKVGAKALGKTALKGTKYVDGVRVAKAGSNKYMKALGYTGTALSRPVSEAWEEFAQEAMGEGLVDYYTSNYSKEGAFTYSGILTSIAEKGSMVLSTSQGRDAVSIGALMGMLGLRLPVAVDPKTSKLKFKLFGKQYGGSWQAVNDRKRKYEDIAEAAENNVSILNKDLDENNVNQTLAGNFRNYTRYIEAQQNMDSAAIDGDINEFKNQEHKQMFSYVQNKVNQGLEGAVLEDIAREREVSLEEFNKKYSRQNETEFTEESKKQAIDNSESRVKAMVKDIKTVQTHVDNNEHTGVNKIAFAIRKLRGSKNQKPLTPVELEQAREMQEQISYLYSAVENTKEREKELSKSIKEKSNGTFNISLLDAIKATPKGIVTDEESGKKALEFNNNANEVGNAILKEWKKESPEEYNLHSESIKQELKDIIKLKLRRSKAAAMYKGMFTYKGAKAFRGFANELSNKRSEEIIEEQREYIKEKRKKGNNGNVNNTKNNERSIFGDSPITDAADLNDIRKGIKEYDSLNRDALSPEAEFQEVLKILDKYPGLIALVFKEGIIRGLNFQGMTTAGEIASQDTDGRHLEIGTMNLMRDISKQFKEFESNPQNSPKFDNADDYNQPAKTEGVTEGTTESNSNDTQIDEGKHQDSILFVNVNEKALEKINGRTIAVRDDKGKLKDHPAVTNSDYKVDYAKVNSPGFLNNEVLSKENHEFEFRIPSNNAWNQSEKVTLNNMWVDVVHVDPKTGEETIIGNLQAFKEGGPQHLKNLREEIVNREKLISNQKEDPKIATIKKKKQEIKKKLKEAQIESKENISKEEYDAFIDKGTISEDILSNITDKIKNNQELTERETVVFNDKTSEINEILETLSTDSTVESELDKIDKEEQEELKKELDKKAKDIPVKIEYHKDENENNVIVTTYRAGNKVATFSKSLTEVSKDGSFLGSETSIPYKTENVESKLSKKIKAKYQAQRDALETTPESNSEDSISKKEQEEENTEEIDNLKSELAEVNKQLAEEMNKDLNFKIKSENDSSVKLISKVKEYLKIKNKKKKESSKQEIIEEFGEEGFQRIVAIENNFDSIVEQFATSGINIFTPTEGKFEEC